ncbi:MAG: hypothetical protein FH748_07015 [Balneolaceae bacterium]|nr:hypothetical protein [Balneolaceae bacterium]
MYEQPKHGTTYDWSFENRIQILDSKHAYGNYFYDRGYGWVITPLLKHEYELDMATQEFTPGDNFVWHTNRNGFRSRFGSYSKSNLAVYSELHTSTQLGDYSELKAHTYLHQNARARRALVELEYLYDLGQGHTIGGLHTLTEFKKDMDITFSYRYSDKIAGNFRFDFSYQNYLNNLVDEVGNSKDPLLEEVEQYRVRYKRIPFFLYTRFNAPQQNKFYWDISFGWQPNIRKLYYYNSDPDFVFQEEEYTYFLNGSFSLNLGSSTLGLYGYIDRHPQERSSGGIPFDGRYEAVQRLRKVGFFYFGNYGRFEPIFRVSREFYFDQQEGTNFEFSIIKEPLDLVFYRWLYDAGVGYTPIDPFLKLVVRYQVLDQSFDAAEFDKMLEHWTSIPFRGFNVSQRLAISVLLKPHDRIHIELGASIDIDRDLTQYSTKPKNFDKGFTKILLKL